MNYTDTVDVSWSLGEVIQIAKGTCRFGCYILHVCQTCTKQHTNVNVLRTKFVTIIVGHTCKTSLRIAYILTTEVHDMSASIITSRGFKHRV